MSKPRAVFFVSCCLSLQVATRAAPSGDTKLVRTTRVKRQIPGGDQPPSASSANQTLREQPVVFNHVYNINVPLESLCSVDLDASTPPGPDDGEVFWSIECLGLNSLTAVLKRPFVRIDTHKHVVFWSFLELFFLVKGLRAELGSSPSMEGPMDPNGPTEYTEQTLDADSQVGVFLSNIFGFVYLVIKHSRIHFF